MGKKLIFQFFSYIVASALKSCFEKSDFFYLFFFNGEELFFFQKKATTHDFLVGNLECNTERGFKNQLYIELSMT